MGVFVLKYGIWNVTQPDPAGVNSLVGAGYSPLTAMVLASRGVRGADKARQLLGHDGPMHDPLGLRDMEAAAARVTLALDRGETLAVFGDYDVDGITATCLLTHYLRSRGARCIPYIPGRLEEGYGLNSLAIRQLSDQGVSLIITVDCGITAMEEALLCRDLGIDLVITDHHECKSELPQAVAVVDPHRPDDHYPHKGLSGVGVAFKLAAALQGSQEYILDRYADMVCLGTVADVMPLVGENRRFVARGLEALRQTQRPGLAALMDQCGCDRQSVCATTIGFMLAPRINAAGRMGQIHLAVELFLTEDPDRGQAMAQALCELNRQRQGVESEIYTQAVSMLPPGRTPQAIVLADDSWHQGVVGIVASRISEEYGCPTFLICLDGDHGKASSRSYGGFNLFSALGKLSPLLESYGGHELAAGFTIARQNIPAFREAICRLAALHTQDTLGSSLDIDCAVAPELLTLGAIQSLEVLEPCGTGCPKPVLMMQGLTVERIQAVGGGKHLRLRLRRGRFAVNAIYFSCGKEAAALTQGETVDVAFTPHINEFRDERTVQMNIVDIRPACTAPCSPEHRPYLALRAGTLGADRARELLPDRATLGLIWRYVSAFPAREESPMGLCRKIVRWSGQSLDLGKLLVSLDVFREVGLLHLHCQHNYITLEVPRPQEKADLTQSPTLRQLQALAAGETL